MSHFPTDMSVTHNTDRPVADFSVILRRTRRSATPPFSAKTLINMPQADFGFEHGAKDEFGDRRFMFITITDRNPPWHGFRRTKVIPRPGNLEQLQFRYLRPVRCGDLSTNDRIRLKRHGNKLIRFIGRRIPHKNFPIIV